jgi:hypothetical protein
MKIKNNIPANMIRGTLMSKMETQRVVVINTLRYVGEACVSEARENGSYMDQTGNLRSSIGYVIAEDGRKIVENVEQSSKGTEKTKGVREARAFMDELIGRSGKGIHLIVVAGMNYAEHVETTKNVLSTAELLAKRLVPSMLGKLGFKKR